MVARALLRHRSRRWWNHRTAQARASNFADRTGATLRGERCRRAPVSVVASQEMSTPLRRPGAAQRRPKGLVRYWVLPRLPETDIAMQTLAWEGRRLNKDAATLRSHWG